MLYSWTMVWFFWKLPAWLFYLNGGEILSAGAYALVLNLLESVAALCLLVLVSLILPRRWFYDSFVARGTALAIAGLSFVMYVSFHFQTTEDYESGYLKPWSLLVALVIVLLVVLLSNRIAMVRKDLEILADRATVLLYVYMPLSIVALLVVLVRWMV